MINEEVYRRCLEAVAPEENRRLHKGNRLDYLGTSNLQDEVPIEQVMDLMKRKRSITIGDAARAIKTDYDVVKPIMKKLAREGKVMSGQDPSAKKTIYWLNERDDFVPYQNRCEATQSRSIQTPRKSPRQIRIEDERNRTLGATSSEKWMHVKSISARANVRESIARGHLKRMMEAGLVEEKKIDNRSFWRRANGKGL